MKNKVFASIVTAFLALSLAACGSNENTAGKAGTQNTASSAQGENTDQTVLDKEAYDKLINSIEPASEAEIAANEWASKVKAAGKLRVGGTRTSFLFSQLDETDNAVRGFDAGLYQLLAHYIFGDSSKYELTQVDSSTRESVLTNGQVDAVFATYSITDERKKVISFAGPYYTSRQAILVSAKNEDITGVDSLKGKQVATQAGSTGPQILAELAPEAKVQEFPTDQEARTALEQKRVDAYVTDYTLMLNAIVKNPNKYKIAGEQFGAEDNYGIGLPLNSDGVEFVNTFLKKVEKEEIWKDLWTITLGNRTGITRVPQVPVLD